MFPFYGKMVKVFFWVFTMPNIYVYICIKFILKYNYRNCNYTMCIGIYTHTHTSYRLRTDSPILGHDEQFSDYVFAHISIRIVHWFK